MYRNDKNSALGVMIAPQCGQNYTRKLVDAMEQAAEGVDKQNISYLLRLLFVSKSNTTLDPYETLIYLFLVYSSVRVMSKIVSRIVDRDIKPDIYEEVSFLEWVAYRDVPAVCIRNFNPALALQVNVFRECLRILGMPAVYADPISIPKGERGIVQETLLSGIRNLSPPNAPRPDLQFLPYRRTSMFLAGESRIQRQVLAYYGVLLKENPNKFSNDSEIHAQSVSARGLYNNPVLKRDDVPVVKKRFDQESFMSNAARLFHIGDVTLQCNITAIKKDIRVPELRDFHSLRSCVLTLLKDVLLFCSVFGNAVVDCNNFSFTRFATDLGRIKVEGARLNRYQKFLLWRYTTADATYRSSTRMLGLGGEFSALRGLWSFSIAMDVTERGLWFLMDMAHHTCVFVDTALFRGTTPFGADFSRMMTVVRLALPFHSFDGMTEASKWKLLWDSKARHVKGLKEAVLPGFSQWINRKPVMPMVNSGCISMKDAIASFLRWRRIKNEIDIMWNYINKRPVVEIGEEFNRMPFSDELLIAVMANHPPAAELVQAIYGVVPDARVPETSQEFAWKLRCLGDMASDVYKLTGLYEPRRFLIRMTSPTNIQAFVRLCDSFRGKGMANSITTRLSNVSQARLLEMHPARKERVYMYVSDDIKTQPVPPFGEMAVLPLSVKVGSDTARAIKHEDLMLWIALEKDRTSVRSVLFELQDDDTVPSNAHAVLSVKAGISNISVEYATRTLRSADWKPEKLVPAFVVSINLYCKTDGYIYVNFL